MTKSQAPPSAPWALRPVLVRTALVGTGLGCALLASACGASSPAVSVAHLGTTTTSRPAKGSSSANGSPMAYSECMRAHGVPDFPDPSPGGGFQFNSGTSNDLNPSSTQFQTANKDCQQLTPTSGLGHGPSPAQIAKAEAQALKFSKCMRAHGVADFPDPQFSNGGRGISIEIKGGPGNDLNPSSQQFQSAQNACGKALPGRPGRVVSSGVGAPSSGAAPSGGGGNVAFGVGGR